jgi:hypothetical protein
MDISYRTRFLFILIIYTFFNSKVNAQENELLPKNKIGAFAGIEWNSISGLWGINYERTLFERDKIIVGTKILYVPKYKLGNMKILGGGCCEYINSGAILINSNFFTSLKSRKNRFFLEPGIGMGFKNYKTGEGSNKSLFPTLEAGFGALIPISQNLWLKWNASALFLHSMGATTATSVSLGF